MATRKEVEEAIAELPPESGVQAVTGKPGGLSSLAAREAAKDGGAYLLILDFDPEAWGVDPECVALTHGHGGYER